MKDDEWFKLILSTMQKDIAALKRDVHQITIDNALGRGKVLGSAGVISLIVGVVVAYLGR